MLWFNFILVSNFTVIHWLVRLSLMSYEPSGPLLPEPITASSTASPPGWDVSPS